MGRGFRGTQEHIFNLKCCKNQCYHLDFVNFLAMVLPVSDSDSVVGLILILTLPTPSCQKYQLMCDG